MNVIIEELKREHLSVSCKLRNNPNLWLYMESEVPLPSTYEIEVAYYTSVNKEKNAHFAIICNNEFVGIVSLKNIKFGTCAVSYCIMREDLWGNCIATKAVALATLAAFRDIDLDLVYIYADKNNVASCNVAKKLGYYYVGSSGIDNCILRYEMTKTAWKRTFKKITHERFFD